MPHTATKQKIDSMLKTVRDHRERIHLQLIVNTKHEYSLPSDYSQFSVTTEYLSDLELDQLLGAFRETGVLTDLHVGEAEFLKALAQDDWYRQRDCVVVYNTVPSGTWHGRDALIPAICGFSHLGYCSSNAYTMGAVSNKYFALRIASAAGVSTGGVWLFDPRLGWCNGRRPPDGHKVIVKPVLECASIGIDDEAIQVTGTCLDHLLRDRSALLSQPLLVQTFVSGYEVEVPIFGAPHPLALPPMGVMLGNASLLADRILTYDLVYGDHYDYYTLCEHQPRLASELQEQSLRLYQELGLYGFARIDYRVAEDGSYVVTDINNIPHLTPAASCYISFKELHGASYSEFLSLVIFAGFAALSPKP